MSNIAASSKILLSFSWDTMTWNTLNKAGKKTEENHYLHVMKKFFIQWAIFSNKKAMEARTKPLGNKQFQEFWREEKVMQNMHANKISWSMMIMN